MKKILLLLGTIFMMVMMMSMVSAISSNMVSSGTNLINQGLNFYDGSLTTYGQSSSTVPEFISQPKGDGIDTNLDATFFIKYGIDTNSVSPVEVTFNDFDFRCSLLGGGYEIFHSVETQTLTETLTIFNVNGTLPQGCIDFAGSDGDFYLELSRSPVASFSPSSVDIRFYEIGVDYNLNLNTEPTLDSVEADGVPVSSGETLTLTEGDTLDLEGFITDLDGDSYTSWEVEGVEVLTDDLTFTFDSNTYGIDTYEIGFWVEDDEYDDVLYFNIEVVSANTEPVINSITPNERLELTRGERQEFTADITDSEGDADYVWTLGGIEVSTTDSYTAIWDNIVPGVYTLELEVSDEEYSNTETTTLEIRKRGGDALTGFATTDIEETTDIEDEGKIAPKKRNFGDTIKTFGRNIGNFFNRLKFWGN